MINRLRQKWTDYWFAPGYLRDLAIFRIGVVGVSLFVLLPTDKVDIVASAVWLDTMYEPILMLRLMSFDLVSVARPSLELLMGMFYVGLVAGLGALVGWRTNICLVIHAYTSLFITAYLYSFGEMHHGQAATLIALGLLAVSPSGARLSLDSLRERANAGSDIDLGYASAKSPYAQWPLKMMLWLFALFYISGDISKLALFTLEEGTLTSYSLDWVNGFTLQYYLAQDALRWSGRFGGDVALWLAQFHIFVLSTQWALVIFQGVFWLAILFPRLLWIFVPVGIMFHAGNWFLLRAPFPQWLACYVALIPWSAGLNLLVHRREMTDRFPDQIEADIGRNTVWLVYDGECPFCSRYTRLLRIRDRVGEFKLLNARETHPVVSEVQGKFDLDDGMVLKIGNRYYHGDHCIYLLALLSEPRGLFGIINAALFRSPTLAVIVYPVLRFGRNLTLKFLGRSTLRHATD